MYMCSAGQDQGALSPPTAGAALLLAPQVYVDCVGAMNAGRILSANLEDELMRFFVWQGEVRLQSAERQYPVQYQPTGAGFVG